MKRSEVCLAVAAFLGCAATASAGALDAAEAAKLLPPAATHTVDFKKEIWPILEASCVSCHGEKRQKSDLRLDSREATLKGGVEGVCVVEGNSAASRLIHMVAGIDPDFDRMPTKGDYLTDAQIGLLRAWIDQGVKWEGGAAPASTADADAAPHAASAAVPGLDGWSVEATTQKGPLATWEFKGGETGPNGQAVLALTEPNHAVSGTFNLCWTPGQQVQNGVIETHVQAIDGDEDQGGGVIWRAQDKDNYYVARINPLEKNFRLYKVVAGTRTQLASAETPDALQGWNAVRIEIQGNRFVASLNGNALLDVTDDTFTAAGGIGLWTKADAATAFTLPVVHQQ